MGNQLGLFGPGSLKREAKLSTCGNYRHSLYREWDAEKGTVMFVMLNPSKADADRDDPTVKKCIKYAKSWGYGSLYIGNLYDWRSTDPEALLKAEKPFSEWNVGYVEDMASKVDMVICGWGHSKIVNTLTDRFPNYSPLGCFKEKAYYLEDSIGSHPKHPLFLRGDLKPKKMFK